MRPSVVSRRIRALEGAIGVSLFQRQSRGAQPDPGPEVQDYVIQRLARLGHHPLVNVSAVQREGLMALVGLGQGVSLVCAAEAEVTYPDVVFRPLEKKPCRSTWPLMVPRFSGHLC